MKLTPAQRKALNLLKARHEDGKPSQWIAPGSYGMKQNTFAALAQRGLAEKRLCPYPGYHHDEFRLKLNG